MHESAATDHWTYTSSGTLASKSTATWKSVTGVTPPITSTPAVITVGNPTSSALFTNPCQGTNGHGINGSAAQKLTAQQCNILKQWIVEGANYD
jgi:hypothetical protein